MRILAWSLALMLMIGVVDSAEACGRYVPWSVADIDYADIIVKGRIANYELVLDPVIRQRNREMAERTGEAGMAQLQSYLSDYAKFDILVDDVLRGQVTGKLTATWDNSTFGEPKTMDSGPFIIALRSRNSPLPPLRGPSATILSAPTTSEFTVLQSPCSRAFIFPVASEEASRMRAQLTAKQ